MAKGKEKSQEGGCKEKKKEYKNKIWKKYIYILNELLLIEWLLYIKQFVLETEIANTLSNYLTKVVQVLTVNK